MSKAAQYSTSTRIRLFYRWAFKRRGFIMRFLLCWSIGLLALSGDEGDNFDLRFQLRGEQPTSPEIIVIHIDPSELTNLFPPRIPFQRPQSGISDITDSYYWSKRAWLLLLKSVLKQDPKAVGITLFFGDNIGQVSLREQEKDIFADPRIVWASRLDAIGLPQDPQFATIYLNSAGLLALPTDDDGVTRNFYPYPSNGVHFVTLLAERAGYSPEYLNRAPGILNINFRGGMEIFPSYSLSDVIFNRIPPGTFRNKIVLIGADSLGGHRVITPLGAMSRAELTGQLLDNALADRWIKRLPRLSYITLLFIFTFIFVGLIYRYPQSVALILCLWTGTLAIALSAWVFDSFYIWVPALSPIILLIGTWIIFVGYRANIVEQRNWHLRQERKYLNQLEQLKNNFISLISHDLKTPIAKIQAVADRLTHQYPEGDLNQDMRSIRKASDELHRYIQSILGVLRVESRDFKIHPQISDINEIIEEAYSQIIELAREKDIDIDKHLEPMFTSEFDPTLIKEVVVNLLENAVKYTPEGGQVDIYSKEIEGFITVEVQDTGEGIPESELENIWGKFVRGKDQDHKTKGTGLGLYLVKYFVELHGGEVALSSEVGKGTRVKFTLPVDAE